MTDLTPTTTPTRPLRRPRQLRAGLLGLGLVIGGLAAPGLAGAETPPHDGRPTDIALPEPAEDCHPFLATCERAPVPEPCPPFVATCDDLAPGGSGPEDPDPEEPGEGDGVDPAVVDQPVPATPTFTG